MSNHTAIPNGNRGGGVIGEEINVRNCWAQALVCQSQGGDQQDTFQGFCDKLWENTLHLWCGATAWRSALGLMSVSSKNILVCLALSVFMGSGSSLGSFGETSFVVTCVLTWGFFSTCFIFLDLTCDVGFVPISEQGML